MSRTLTQLMLEINERLNELDALAVQARADRARLTHTRAARFLSACETGRTEAMFLNPLESK